MDDAIRQQIENDLKNNNIMLYMKGTADSPMCGFSARAVEILKNYNIPFSTFNILTDEAVRQGLKEYSDWPTYPQLYVKGELIGGCDIMAELDENGELKKILEAAR